MLLELNVKDIALIRKASVSFDKGLNVMTGETGTGKSVIIDSALLALGGKVRGDLILRGAEYGYIELIFGIEPEKLQMLKDLDVFPDEEGMLVISRKIMPGRSVSRINDETVTLSKLRAVTSLLIDIYGQNEFHTLMDRKAHLAILDDFMAGETSELRAAVRDAYHAYKSALADAAGYTLDEKQRLREMDMAEYEIREIDEARLKEGEEDELAARFRKASHSLTIAEDVNDAYQALLQCDTGRAVSGISHALRYDEDLKQIHDEIMDLQAVLDVLLKDLSDYAESVEVDEGELRQMEQRLDQIRGLEAKYGATVADIMRYRDGACERLKELQDYEENRLKAERQAKAAEERLMKLSADLSAKRREGAERLTAAIREELKDLGFEKASLAMDFARKSVSEDGYDDAGFIASMNPGEAMKNLSEVASGGELSRVMLAVKTVLAETDRIPTLIFDEIDTGISGRTAQKVAEKMDVIGLKHQVICVSHLPQIAAMADSHYVIRKEEQDGRNITEIAKLDKEGSENELARLLGGVSITRAVLDNAGEMKELAARGKAERRAARSSIKH